MPALNPPLPPPPPADASAEQRAAYWESTANSYRNRVIELDGIVAHLQRLLFGRSSERLTESLGENEQPLLGFEALALEGTEGAAAPQSSQAEIPSEGSETSNPPSNTKPRRPYTPRRSIILSGLRIELDERIPAEVLANPENFRRIGEEHSDLLERKQAEFFIRRLLRPKFVPIDTASRVAAAEGDTAVTAPIIAALDILFPHSYASPSLLAWVIVSHFEDHLPYHRIHLGMKRQGIILPASQLGRWVGQLYHTYLGPILNAIKVEVFKEGGVVTGNTSTNPNKEESGNSATNNRKFLFIEFDESPVRYLPKKKPRKARGRAHPKEPEPLPRETGPETGPETLEKQIAAALANMDHDSNEPIIKTGNEGQCPKGYLWVARNTSNGAVIFHWATSRGQEVIELLVPKDFYGVIMCDDYVVYRSLRDDRNADDAQAPAVILAACMAHIRRKFYDASKAFPVVCRRVVRAIRKLYKVEDKLREANATPEATLQARLTHCKPILEGLKRYWEEQSQLALPQSSLGKALSYALAQWSELQPYLEHATVPLDNNAAERAIRPTAVGKKNYLFFGSAESGHANAAMYTLLANARQHGLNPEDYLRELLSALPTMKASEAPQWTPRAYAARKAKAEAEEAKAAEGVFTPAQESKLAA